DGKESGFDGDLDRAGFAELVEQVDELALGLGRLGDDEVALEFAERADGAAVVAPAVGVDGFLDEGGDFLDEFFAGFSCLLLLSLAAAPAASAEQAPPPSTAAAPPAAAAAAAAALILVETEV